MHIPLTTLTRRRIFSSRIEQMFKSATISTNKKEGLFNGEKYDHHTLVAVYDNIHQLLFGISIIIYRFKRNCGTQLFNQSCSQRNFLRYNFGTALHFRITSCNTAWWYANKLLIDKKFLPRVGSISQQQCEELFLFIHGNFRHQTPRNAFIIFMDLPPPAIYINTQNYRLHCHK